MFREFWKSISSKKKYKGIPRKASEDLISEKGTDEIDSPFDWEKMVANLSKSIKKDIVDPAIQRDRNRETFKQIIARKDGLVSDSELQGHTSGGDGTYGSYENSEERLQDPFDTGTDFGTMKTQGNESKIADLKIELLKIGNEYLDAKQRNDQRRMGELDKQESKIYAQIKELTKSNIAKRISSFLKDEEETPATELGVNTDIEEQKDMHKENGAYFVIEKNGSWIVINEKGEQQSRGFDSKEKALEKARELNKKYSQKAIDISYAGPTPNSKLSRQDLEGDSSTTKSRFAKSVYYVQVDYNNDEGRDQIARIDIEASSEQEAKSKAEKEFYREYPPQGGYWFKRVRGVELKKSQVQKDKIEDARREYREAATQMREAHERGDDKAFNEAKRRMIEAEKIFRYKSRTEKIIRHEGDKWILYSHKGKVIGRHPSKESAEAQERAVEANKMLKGYGDYSSVYDWEGAVVDALVKKLNITQSDAQGIVEAHSFELSQGWTSGKTAQETAKIIAQKSLHKSIVAKHLDNYLKHCIESELPELMQDEKEGAERYHELADETSQSSVAEILESMASDEESHYENLEHIANDLSSSSSNSEIESPNEETTEKLFIYRSIIAKHLDEFLKDDEYNQENHYLSPEVLNEHQEVVGEHTSDK